MSSPFTHARWLWPDSHHWDLHNCFALFRRVFDLASVPAHAPLFITADQSYRLYVNGHFIARGPARGFQHRWPYDEIDLAAHLRPGRNVIAVRAYNPGFSNFQYLTQGFAGLLVAARWDNFELLSDSAWRARRQPSVSRDTVPSSVQLFPQEHIDLRLEPSGDWTSLDFDDATWSAAVGRPWNSGPWFDLEPRGIPMLDECSVAPARLLGIHSGQSAASYAHVRDVVALRMSEDRSHPPSPSPAPAPASAAATSLAVPATAPGTFRSFLFDFGHTVVGNLIFTITGASGGEILDTHLGESLDIATLTIDQCNPSGSRMAFGDRLICRPGDQAHRFHHHYGFRYLELTVRDAPAGLRVTVALDWIGYPLPHHGAFASSNSTLTRIWNACAWTQQCCSLDAYVDTPWREQVQWWGDARVQAWNTFHLNGDTRLFRRGIAQIAAQTTPDGLTYGHAPTMAHSCILPDFTLIWMLTLWDFYWQTGSTEPFLSHRDTIRQALSYFERHTDPTTGLVTYDDRFWLFLDWTDLHKDGSPSVLNLWLLLALDKLVLLHRAADLPADDSASLEAWSARLRAALAKLVGSDCFLRDGLDHGNQIVNTSSIHAQVLGLAAAIPGLNAVAIEQNLLIPFIRGESQPKATPSAYWITYLLTVLTERGHQTEVVRFIERHWSAMADYGTTWENFVPQRGVDSHSHAWSAHPLFHLMQTVGGIVQTAPAWREITFRPVFQGDHARTVVPTPQGPITAAWRRTSLHQIAVALTLPEGIRARVLLPNQEPLSVTQTYETTVAV